MSTSTPSNVSERPTPDRIMQFTWGFASTLVMEAAIENRVFDVLDGGERTLEELVSATGGSRRGIRAVADALVGLQLLAKKGDRYALTPESAAFLVSTKPSFMGGVARHASRQLIPNWLSLSEIVRTGRPSTSVNQQSQGAEFFVDLVEDIFNMSFGAASVLAAEVVPNQTESYRVLDLAAGSGVWGIALAKKSAAVKVTAVDWPAVIPVTRKIAARHQVADRFNYIEGDLLSADFGTGYQLATLGHILHSEGEVRSRALLKKVFASLAPGGTIAIAEFTPDDDRTGPAGPLLFGVNMLVNTDEGDVFTFSQVRGWLSECGFEKVRQLNAPGPSPLILGEKR